MEKLPNYKELGLWMIRDFDGLYLCTRRPYKNFYGEHPSAFTWGCEGDFIKLSNLNYFDRINERFKDLKFEDEPQKVEVVPDYFLKQETVAE